MTTPGLIALLDLSTSTSDRPDAIARLERERPTIEAMPGCIRFRVFASRTDDREITVVHEWADPGSFDGYLASSSFARSGEVLRPILVAAPTSRRYRVELIEMVG